MATQREEARQKELAAVADARYKRLVQLNEMDNRIAASDAAFARIERARREREAAARRARLAVAATQPTHKAPTVVRTIIGGRLVEVRSLGDGITEHRYLDGGMV